MFKIVNFSLTNYIQVHYYFLLQHLFTITQLTIKVMRLHEFSILILILQMMTSVYRIGINEMGAQLIKSSVEEVGF